MLSFDLCFFNLLPKFGKYFRCSPHSCESEMYCFSGGINNMLICLTYNLFPHQDVFVGVVKV